MAKTAFENLSTPELEALLEAGCDGEQELPLEDVLLICRILAERGPKTDVQKTWESFKRDYFPKLSNDA